MTLNCLSSRSSKLHDNYFKNDDRYRQHWTDSEFAWTLSCFEIILKLFQCFIYYCTCNRVWNWNKFISAAERVLKLFQNYFSDIEHVGKYSWAAIILWNNFEIISGKFPRQFFSFHISTFAFCRRARDWTSYLSACERTLNTCIDWLIWWLI